MEMPPQGMLSPASTICVFDSPSPATCAGYAATPPTAGLRRSSTRSGCCGAHGEAPKYQNTGGRCGQCLEEPDSEAAVTLPSIWRRGPPEFMTALVAVGHRGAAATPRPWSMGGAVQGSAQCGAPPPWQRDDGEVRRYGRFALIGAVAASIAGVGIGYPSFHNDPPHSPVIASIEPRSGDDRGACPVEGKNFVTVPYLIGKHVLDAAARARASGLQLVGTGVSGGDPAGASAKVVAQKPPGGIRVPVGSCVGFRTRL